jgi:hypothetical protein
MKLKHSPAKQQKISVSEGDTPVVQPFLLSMKDAAKSLNCSLSHFYKVVLPSLKTIRIGERHLVSVTELMRYIHSLESDAA